MWQENFKSANLLCIHFQPTAGRAADGTGEYADEVIVITVAALSGNIGKGVFLMFSQQFLGMRHAQTADVLGNTAAIELSGKLIQLSLSDAKPPAELRST